MKTCIKCNKEKDESCFSYVVRFKRLSTICKSCASLINKKWKLDNKEHVKKKRLERNLARKRVVLSYYGNGNFACVHCGNEDQRVLSIDHVIGGMGREHRRQGKSSGVLYQWLIDNNFPKGFQTLCMNCQFIKRYEENEYGGKP